MVQLLGVDETLIPVDSVDVLCMEPLDYIGARQRTCNLHGIWDDALHFLFTRGMLVG